MRLQMTVLLMAALFAITGCGSAGAPSPPVTNPGSAPSPSKPVTPAPMPTIGNPNQRPTYLGIFQESLGPGLVIQGYAQEPQIQVALVKGSTQLKAETVEQKEAGFSLAWTSPKESGTEVVVSASGSEVIRGPVHDQMHAGLFYSKRFTAARLDVTNKSSLTARISGHVKAPGGRLWVEYRDDQKVLEIQEVILDQAAPKAASFTLARPLPAGTHKLYFYLLNENGTVDLDLILPVVTR